MSEVEVEVDVGTVRRVLGNNNNFDALVFFPPKPIPTPTPTPSPPPSLFRFLIGFLAVEDAAVVAPVAPTDMREAGGFFLAAPPPPPPLPPPPPISSLNNIVTIL